MKLLASYAAIFIFALMPALHANAHSGDLDPTFGSGGIRFYGPGDAGSCRRGASAMGVHPDGSIIVAGWEFDAAGNERIDASKLTARGNVIHDGLIDLHDTSASKALAIDPISGYMYLGADVGNIGYVIGLNPDLSVNAGFGYTSIAAFNDFTHHTHINDVFFNPSDSYPIYLTGTYDGAGNQQIVLSRFGTDGGNPNTTSYGIFSGDNIATSVGVYEDFSGIHTVTGGYAGGECFVAGFKPVYVSGGNEWNFTTDPNYTSQQYGYGGTQACYTDTLHVFPDNGSQLAAGRVINTDGSWSAYFELIGAGGAGTSTFRIFKMSAWGDNSLRKILVQPDGKWIFVGFTGVDASANPGAWTGRFNPDGSPDPTFGSGGASLINFDPQDYAYGQALSAGLDRYGRVVLAGTEWSGVSDPNGNDCTRTFVARLQSDDLIFTDGFEP